jgi:threonylcarbamoyladenosine tRNA methylthiotransferase MtaB
MKKISFTTIGCKLNFSESTTIVRDFLENGYEIVPFGKKSDIIIINTCTVTAQAERKSKYAVKKAHKDSPNAKIIVVGCAAQLRPENFSTLEGVQLVLGAKDKFNVFDILEKEESKKIYSCDINLVKKFDQAYSLDERTRSFLKIQDGCDYICTYCTIPKARGKSRNAPIKDVVSEAKIIAQQGIKEIILTGVNIGDFGKSTGENFFSLIKELDKIEGIERYRISSIEPNLLTDEIIDFVASSSKFMPHFHIPLQSGSDNVLRLMKRRYNTEKFVDRILTANKFIPDAFFGIDLIVGFPGETQNDFEQTYKLLDSLPVSYLHLFPYSDRPGTVASQIKNKVPSEWKKRREKKLKILSDKKHLDFYKKFSGTQRRVLFEHKEKNGMMTGYTDNYIRVAVPYEKKLAGEIKNVQLISIENEIFNGKIL